MKSKLALAISIFWTTSASAITIPTVPVGNPGNPADTRYIDTSHPSGVGSVGYSFNMGKTEVTYAQYTAFLNAVAAVADPIGLYNSNTLTGIVRTGASGHYSYAVNAPALNGAYPYDDKPVVFINSGIAMRFANWLHNGQPTGREDATTTERGAYTLDGAFSAAALAAVTRNPGARWWLSNEDEWYKAAYYDPNVNTYYDYPIGTNSAPNNNLPSSDTGNSANYWVGTTTTGNGSFPFTDAGAYALSKSPYSTLDQGGNAVELTETEKPSGGDYFRIVRGGSWTQGGAPYLQASQWNRLQETSFGGAVGFRIASSPAAVGDFNGDGFVDATDYVVWRKNNGSQIDYNVWRSHFGQTAGSGSVLPSSSVPEPVSAILMIAGIGAYMLRRQKSVRSDIRHDYHRGSAGVDYLR